MYGVDMLQNATNSNTAEKNSSSQSEVVDNIDLAKIYPQNNNCSPVDYTHLQTPAPDNNKAYNDRIEGRNLVNNEKKAEKQVLEVEDGSKPLANSRYERMVQLRLEGASQGQSYKATNKKAVSMDTAMTQASRIFKQPEVARRLSYLEFALKPKKTTSNLSHGVPQQKSTQPQQRQNDIKKPSKSGLPKNEQELRDQLVRLVWDTLNDDARPNDVSSLVQRLVELTGLRAPDTEQSEMTPQQLARFQESRKRMIINRLKSSSMFVSVEAITSCGDHIRGDYADLGAMIAELSQKVGQKDGANAA